MHNQASTSSTRRGAQPAPAAVRNGQRNDPEIIEVDTLPGNSKDIPIDIDEMDGNSAHKAIVIENIPGISADNAIDVESYVDLHPSRPGYQPEMHPRRRPSSSQQAHRPASGGRSNTTGHSQNIREKRKSTAGFSGNGSPSKKRRPNRTDKVEDVRQQRPGARLASTNSTNSTKSTNPTNSTIRLSSFSSQSRSGTVTSPTSAASSSRSQPRKRTEPQINREGPSSYPQHPDPKWKRSTSARFSTPLNRLPARTRQYSNSQQTAISLVSSDSPEIEELPSLPGTPTMEISPFPEDTFQRHDSPQYEPLTPPLPESSSSTRECTRADTVPHDTYANVSLGVAGSPLPMNLCDSEEEEYRSYLGRDIDDETMWSPLPSPKPDVNGIDVDELVLDVETDSGSSIFGDNTQATADDDSSSSCYEEEGDLGHRHTETSLKPYTYPKRHIYRGSYDARSARFPGTHLLLPKALVGYRPPDASALVLRHTSPLGNRSRCMEIERVMGFDRLHLTTHTDKPPSSAHYD
ncbi:hypothetical protein FISHEDRAFT_69433 [Fistulina hepatica ATCC 64428]|uniref:Uncharacterized protein n=1 Tax=Fistulina hepatica ATCC 64428 TaxID=1128425 RepID=A0A0D7ANT3_9AGAR|nr:hypothetical protein FISHEDRAFT_69433 [Fistulina hepatica ATCC 64428]